MSGGTQHSTILIVEDQIIMRALLRDYLQTAFPKCNILEAANGSHVLEICSGYRPRIILMDVCLPDANGIELTRRVKALMPKINVIVISYHTGRVYAEQALAAGALAYIVKEKLLAELIPAVADVLGIAPAGGSR